MTVDMSTKRGCKLDGVFLYVEIEIDLRHLMPGQLKDAGKGQD
jgi:hypothetical protein